MGCNKDNDCYRLYSRVYPNLENKIDSSIDNINEQLNEIIDSLTKLYVPEDYLGNKVKERLTKINESFTEDIDSLTKEKKSVDTFIIEKINEHKWHYDTYRKEQEKLKLEKEETQ